MNFIPESALPPLRQQILVLRIIVLALVAGVAIFGGYAIAQNLGKPQLWAGKLDAFNLILLAWGCVMLLAGLVAPAIVFRYFSPYFSPRAVVAASWRTRTGRKWPACSRSKRAFRRRRLLLRFVRGRRIREFDRVLRPWSCFIWRWLAS
jgi:hypothetical protein